MKDTFDVEICKRRYSVEVEGLTQMEVTGLAKQVENEMLAIGDKYGTPDTSKLAVLTALSFAMKFTKLQESFDDARAGAARKLVELDHVLRSAVDAASASR